MRRFLIPGVIAVAAVAVLALLTFGVSQQTDTSSIDARVADGKFPLAPNAQSRCRCWVVGVEDPGRLRGKVVVLNVFASWCRALQAEAPMLAREQQTLAEPTHDARRHLPGQLSASEQFARQYHITYPVLRDMSGNFVRSFGTRACRRRS